MYPLDPPRASLLARLADHPYPAVPEGFGISEALWKASMHPAFVAAVSLGYLVCAKMANAARAKAPPRDRIKDTWLTQAVLAHNVFLALYSAWTAVASIRHLSSYFGRGFAAGGVEGALTAYCTMPTHESAVTQEGVAPFGLIVWLFYISKLYEIVDSLILAAKGKHVSNLQSYHHAGAMWTMWSGVRYSASPTWIFASYNSVCHSLMYGFYAVSSLKIRVPALAKQALTTLQITQLFVGWWTAFFYLLVTYRPDAFPAHQLPSIGTLSGTSLALVGNAASNLTSTFSKDSIFALPTLDQHAIESAITASLNSNGRAACVASTGHAFGVALNCAYLLPLIVLFARFYLKSYIKRGDGEKVKVAKAKAAKAQ